MYTPTNMNPYFGKVDVRGKTEFGGELLGREYANFTSYIYKDYAPKRVVMDFSDIVMDSLGENPIIHEWWHTYSGTDVTNDGPIHAKSGLQFSGSNVELNGTVVSDSYMMVSASRAFTTPVDGEVNLYVPNGNIGIYGGDIDIDAVIYAPNGTVQISGSNIQIDGVIIAKEIQISGQDVVLNQNLDLSLAPDIQYYNEALWLIAECAYNTETELFTLDWESTFEEGTFDIYTSADDMNYTLKDTVQNTDTYAFSIDNPVDNLYIKVVQTLENGVCKESNTIRMAYDEESGYVMAVDDDTDGDGLTDIYEHFLETDKRNPDTDGDGLSDGDEVYLTDTDPLYRDSDEDTIPDGDEDPDFDGLTNLQEIQYGTKPQNPDSDGDTLSDYDEIFIYGTDLLKSDTDNDGLNDGDEIALGLNPLLPDSDGDGIPDGDEVFQQSKELEVKTYDKTITEITVDMSANGNIDKNLNIESMYNVDEMSTNVVGLIGEPFDFSTTSNFDSATITFEIDQSKLGNTAFDNLMILRYNEETKTFEEMPTNCNAANSTVSTTTTHFSQYMVVDSTRWYDTWESSMVEMRKMWIGNTSYMRNLNTIFLVDCSSDMASVDSYTYVLRVGFKGVTEENINSIKINSHSDEEAFCVKLCKRTEICETIIDGRSSSDRAAVITFSNGIETNTGMTGSWWDLVNGLQNVNSYGSSSNLNAAISEAMDFVDDSTGDKYRIVILTHSNVSVFSDLWSYNWNNTDVNLINLGSGSVSSSVENIVNHTGGTVYNAVSASELTSQTGGIVYTPPQFVGEDWDGDTIPDIVELYGLQPNGQPIGTSMYMKDSDGDGLDDNVELGYIPLETLMNSSSEYISRFAYISDPSKPDSDGDGLKDPVDPHPLVEFDDRFQIADNYNIDYMDIYPQDYLTLKESSLDSYNSMEFASTSEKIKYYGIKAKLLAMVIGGNTNLSALINEGYWGPTPTAAELIAKYIANSGSNHFIKAVPYAVALTRHQRDGYYNLMNDFMAMVESTVMMDKSYTFSTTNTANYSVSFYGARKDSKETDWWLSIGGGQNGIISDVESYKDSDGIHYSARIKFYLFDFYDWSTSNSEKDLYKLHCYGLAKSFLNYGYYETTVTWDKGSRYPHNDTYSFVNLKEFEFDGITDSSLYSAYLDGILYYNSVYAIS